MRAPQRNKVAPPPNRFRLRPYTPLFGSLQLVLQSSTRRMDGIHWYDTTIEELSEFNKTLPADPGRGAFRVVARKSWLSHPRLVLQIQYEYVRDKNGPLGIECDRIQDWRDAQIEDLGLGPTSFVLGDLLPAGA